MIRSYFPYFGWFDLLMIAASIAGIVILTANTLAYDLGEAVLLVHVVTMLFAVFIIFTRFLLASKRREVDVTAQLMGP